MKPFLAFFLSAALSMAALAEPPNPATGQVVQKQEHAAVFNASMNVLIRHVTDPVTAEFGKIDDKDTEIGITDNAAKVRAWFTLKFKSGMRVRCEWCTILQRVNGTWKVEALYLGDKIYGVHAEDPL